MKIYDQLCAIANNAGAPFLQHHSEDLFEIDREQLLFDSQQGSNYIWVLKSNGCGTWFFSACDDNKWRESIISDDDRCFHISCTSPNQGTVTEIHSLSEFKELCSRFDKQTKSLKPRRTSLWGGACRHLGY
ncbi:hypothetical protein [Shewanella sp. MBTL60-007]|uniref:hypothetical protein n=1 Tax=Shewanella sp. MBTL60-007 TaxID=2815911 RepID=UPI001C80EE93|nr:hypothetical protein [Shewanella sp. MBTL60-007]